MARALSEGFAYQGERSAYRGGQPRGESTVDLPPTAFVSFLQNHDQVGNRAFGDRLASLAEPDAVRALHALVLLSPQIPLLFMGEEWGSRTPFLFFCDFAKELGEAVRNGRREEFSRFSEFSDPHARERIPDPNALETFARSKLDWREPEAPMGRSHIAFIEQLLSLRRQAIVPFLAEARPGDSEFHVRGRALKACWPLAHRIRLHLAANLSSTVVDGLGWTVPGERLYSIPESPSGTPCLDRLGPWSLLVTVENGAAVE